MHFLRTLRAPLNPAIAALVSACVLIGTLAVMIESRASILRHGEEIVLKTAPVDPRDLMRGDYVRLRYEDISTVDIAVITGQWPEKDRMAPLWLTLVAGEDGLADVIEVSTERPSTRAEGEVVLKSKPERLRAASKSGARTGSYNLTFGIERYYVPEGEGLEIEKARNQERTTVAVRVSEDGEAQIARLMIDGETLYAEPLY